MKFNTIVSFLFTLTHVLADPHQSQHPITNSELQNDADSWVLKTVLPFILLVPGTLEQLKGNVTVSFDTSGAFLLSLFLARRSDPFTFTRAVNLTQSRTSTHPSIPTTKTAYLNDLTLGDPVTVPIKIPIPGTNETGTGVTTLKLSSPSSLGVTTSISAGARNITISDAVAVLFEPSAQTAGVRPNTNRLGDGAMLRQDECNSDADCEAQNDGNPNCDCVGFAPKTCRCITVSNESVSSVGLENGIGC
jgi:hypothetical protein